MIMLDLAVAVSFGFALGGAFVIWYYTNFGN